MRQNLCCYTVNVGNLIIWELCIWKLSIWEMNIWEIYFENQNKLDTRTSLPSRKWLFSNFQFCCITWYDMILLCAFGARRLSVLTIEECLTLRKFFTFFFFVSPWHLYNKCGNEIWVIQMQICEKFEQLVATCRIGR